MGLNSGDYDDLFENIGEFIQRVNDFVGLYSALDTDLSEIQAELSGNSRLDVYASLPSTFEGFKSTVHGWIGIMNGKVRELLTHRDDVLEKLALGNQTDVRAVLRELIRDMNDASESVNASSVTIGGITKDAVNTNVGTLLLGKVLDGVSAPAARFAAHPEYNGLDSELALPADTLYVTCVADNPTSGRAEGQESFQVVGKPTSTPFSHQDGGSGPGPTFQTLNTYSIFSGLEFESFTSDIPDGWTVDAGDPGVHILEETTTVYRGNAALKLVGDGSESSISLSQELILSRVTPLRRYCLAGWVRGTAGMSAGTLTIQFEGTGYTATSSEKIELDSTALAAQTSYDVEHFYINMPQEIPEDMKLVIKLTGTPSAHAVYLDGFAFGPVTYHNGIHMAILAGAEKFLLGDRFTFDVTNDDNGVIQAYFRDAFQVQLPSSGTPTIDDSLAT